MKNGQYGAGQTVLDDIATTRRVADRAIAVALIASIGCTVAAGAAAFALTRKPEIKYFLAQEDGRIITMDPVDQPFTRDSDVIQFAQQAMASAMTINYSRHEQDISGDAEFFTQPEGYQGYLRMLEESQIMKMMTEGKVIMNSIVNDAVIIKRGLWGDRYAYQVQMEMRTTYLAGSETTQDTRTVTATVVRVPAWQSPRGLAIANFQAI